MAQMTFMKLHGNVLSLGAKEAVAGRRHQCNAKSRRPKKESEEFQQKLGYPTII